MNKITDPQQDYLANEATFPPIARYSLIPWWIKLFIWMFVAGGVVMVTLVVAGFFGLDVSFEFLGLRANNTASVDYFLIVGVFALNVIVAVGMAKEKRWAALLGIIAAWITMAVCCFTMVRDALNNPAPGTQLSFRLEIVFAILLLRKLMKIRYDWENGVPSYELSEEEEE